MNRGIMSKLAAAPSRSLKAVIGIFATIVLGLGLPILAATLAELASGHFGLPSMKGPTLPWLYSQHAFQLVLALIGIAILKRLLPADYGLHAPPGKTYVRAAILWGLFFGVLMLVVDYAPQILAHARPPLDYKPTPVNVTGWLFFEGVYVGPTEEIPFRSLLVTFLAMMMPGKVRLGRFDMNAAGVVVALIFALAHVTNFWVRPWPLALGQQLYAFALGVLYAYWLEKSKSIVAPIIGHNVSDVSETALQLAWATLG